MKIERLSENQMRFTVWKEDFEENDIDISDIAGNKSGKADELLKYMMQRAKDEFGFEPDSAPLVVEAMQVDKECMVFLVTKLEEGVELDSKYAYIQKLKESLKNGVDMFLKDGQEDAVGVHITQDDTSLTGGVQSGSPTPGAPFGSSPVESKKDNILPYVIYTFTDIENIITVAKMSESYYKSDNTLYITPDEVTYYLVASHNRNTDGEFKLLCRQLREFGKPYSFNYATKYYMDEHYNPVIRDKALQTLSELK